MYNLKHIVDQQKLKVQRIIELGKYMYIYIYKGILLVIL